MYHINLQYILIQFFFLPGVRCKWSHRDTFEMSLFFLLILCIAQTLPFFGVQPTILNEHGEELEGEAEGYLVRGSCRANIQDTLSHARAVFLKYITAMLNHIKQWLH